MPNKKRTDVFQLTAVISCLLSICATVGCGSGEYRDVSGVVTVDGKPLPKGDIVFHPAQGRPARGTIGSDGKYTLTTLKPGDGAKPGEYKVTITAVETSGGSELPASFEEELSSGFDMAGGPRVKSKRLVSEQYSVKAYTPLSVTVTPDGDNEHNFDLKFK